MIPLPPSPGHQFRTAIIQENPFQIVGTINSYSALLAQKAGFQALYLSGAGVANASYGLPDLGVTTLHHVLEEARRILNTVPLPLLVDIDTGWDIPHTIREMIHTGVAAVHIEDQVPEKRCGHRPGKKLIKKEEMVNRIKSAIDARTDPHFVVMARTDALSEEGLDSTLDRVYSYIEAGADMIFLEGARTLAEYQQTASCCKNVPLLANITEFGLTPLFTKEELRDAGVNLILYPLSAFRAMSKAALTVYQSIRMNGTQKFVIDQMQTREELYEILHYYEKEPAR